MTISRGDIKGRILRLLNKTSGYSGFFDDAKVNDVVDDCIDYVAARMFIGGEGWLTSIAYIDTTTVDTSYDLPTGFAIIEQVRYLVGNQYIPMIYDDAAMSAQVAAGSGFTQFPFRWRFVDNQIYLNPVPAQAGPQFMQVEGKHYPVHPTIDAASMDPTFDNAMLHYIKWRAASQLVSQVGKTYKEWQDYENQWYTEMENIINRRVRTPMTVKEFDP